MFKPLDTQTTPSDLAHEKAAPSRLFASFREVSATLGIAAVLLFYCFAASAQLSQSAPTAAKIGDSQAEPRLATRLVMSRVVLEGKAEKLTQAPAVQPGDLLQYTAHFGNPTAAPMHDVVPSLPVPAGTQWVPSSDQPTGAIASVDGRNFGPLPLMRKQLQANGQWAQVPVPLAEIRYLRWPARELAAGDSFATSLRVRVLSGDAVNASLATPTPSATTASVFVPGASDPSRSQVAAR
jgi:uncharacterized repeat protein (TIGR01451 family)